MIDATPVGVARVMERRSKSAVLCRAVDPEEGHDARRPRPAAHCGVLRRRRPPAQAAGERSAKDHRCGGRHAVRRPGGARHRVGLFPVLPSQDAFWKRRARLAEHIEQLMAAFAQDCPGYPDRIVLLDSTPVECGRSVETARRSDLGPACAHHYSRSHSRWFWGMRLHLLGAPDGTIRAVILASADQTERDVARRLFAISLRGGETIVCDKGYAGAEFAEHAASTYRASVLRPARKSEPDNGLHLSSIRQRIESIFWTLKDH